MALTPEESRVLGCLLEKERTTPDAYPLSLNAPRGRVQPVDEPRPVVRYREDDVEAALDSCASASFVRRGVYPGAG